MINTANSVIISVLSNEKSSVEMFVYAAPLCVCRWVNDLCWIGFGRCSGLLECVWYRESR